MATIIESLDDVERSQEEARQHKEDIYKNVLVGLISQFPRRLPGWHGKLTKDQVISCSAPREAAEGEFVYTLTLDVGPEAEPLTLEVHRTLSENGRHVFDENQVRKITCGGVDVTDFADLRKVLPARPARLVHVAPPDGSAQRGLSHDLSRDSKATGFDMAPAG